jgi:hypothetical protein
VDKEVDNNKDKAKANKDKDKDRVKVRSPHKLLPLIMLLNTS